MPNDEEVKRVVDELLAIARGEAPVRRSRSQTRPLLNSLVVHVRRDKLEMLKRFVAGYCSHWRITRWAYRSDSEWYDVYIEVRGPWLSIPDQRLLDRWLREGLLAGGDGGYGVSGFYEHDPRWFDHTPVPVDHTKATIAGTFTLGKEVAVLYNDYPIGYGWQENAGSVRWFDEIGARHDLWGYLQKKRKKWAACPDLRRRFDPKPWCFAFTGGSAGYLHIINGELDRRRERRGDLPVLYCFAERQRYADLFRPSRVHFYEDSEDPFYQQESEKPERASSVFFVRNPDTNNLSLDTCIALDSIYEQLTGHDPKTGQPSRGLRYHPAYKLPLGVCGYLQEYREGPWLCGLICDRESARLSYGDHCVFYLDQRETVIRSQVYAPWDMVEVEPSSLPQG